MKKILSVLLAAIAVFACACTPPEQRQTFSLTSVPAYSGAAYVELDDNKPDFTEKEKKCTKSFEKYSRLDELGRCSTAFANVSVKTMPTEKRGSISSVRPTGWVQKSYGFIRDGMLYNRCHLIAYQLTGENANERNLITGTRYMNTEGMLPFENKVADYVRSTRNHVLYRVTPIFDGDNLLASGVEMEAWSVEDNGAGVCYDVYCYNVQPGVAITYASGRSKSDGTISGRSRTKGSTSSAASKRKTSSAQTKYVLNTGTMKFHRSNCSAVPTIAPENKRTYSGKRRNLIKKGYTPCGMCNP